MDKQNIVYTCIEIIFFNKRIEVLIQATAWIILENIMIGERRQYK